MTEPNSIPAIVGIADRLIRRLRISDPPERFVKRAVTALQEALNVAGMAWVSEVPREPVIVSGMVEGVEIEDYRRLARIAENEAVYVANSDDVDLPIPKAISRFFLVAIAPNGGRLVGINPPHDRPTDVEIQTLFSVASLIGTQKANARIYSDLKDLLFGVIRALTAAIDAKDPYTSGHSERVARIAVRISQQLGMNPHDQGDLYLMGLLHDVGKIGVDDVILKKQGKLTPEEYQHIQAHVRIGVHILSDLKKLHHLLPGVAYHHEKLDGTGYPAGLSGEDIPLAARILAAADSFDAMSSSRPYRGRMNSRQIDEELRKGAGRQWDERVIDALFACRDDVDHIRQKGLGESLQAAISETLGRN